MAMKTGYKGGWRRWAVHLGWIVLLTLAIEGATCLFRFGFDLQSTRDTQFLSRYLLGWRVHHGYIGLALVLLGAFAWPRPPLSRIWGVRTGWALVASDLIHHFIVLWLATGDPQFHIRYAP